MRVLQHIGILTSIIFLFGFCSSNHQLLPPKLDKSITCIRPPKLPPIDFTAKKDSTVIAIFKARPVKGDGNKNLSWRIIYSKNNNFYKGYVFFDTDSNKIIYRDQPDTLYFKEFGYNQLFDPYNNDDIYGWMITKGDTLYHYDSYEPESLAQRPNTKLCSEWYYRVPSVESYIEQEKNYNNCCKLNDASTIFRASYGVGKCFRFYLEKNQYYVDIYNQLFINYHIPLKCNQYKNDAYKFEIDGTFSLDGLHPLSFDVVTCNYLYYPKDSIMVREFFEDKYTDTFKVVGNWDYGNSRVDSSFYTNTYYKQLKVYDYRQKNKISDPFNSELMYELQK